MLRWEVVRESFPTEVVDPRSCQRALSVRSRHVFWSRSDTNRGIQLNDTYTCRSSGPIVVTCKPVMMLTIHGVWGARWFPCLHRRAMTQTLWNPGPKTLPQSCINPSPIVIRREGGGQWWFGRCVYATQRQNTMIAFGTNKPVSVKRWMQALDTDQRSDHWTRTEDLTIGPKIWYTTSIFQNITAKSLKTPPL